MKLVETHVEDRPAATQRLVGTVQYADGRSDTYWFEAPSEYRLSTSGNPWLASLLPLAVTISEDVEIPLPVDSELFEGARGLVGLWKSWYPELSLIAVKAEIASIAEDPCEAMAFFSGGVDSYFTVLRHPVRHLVSVLGFDMPITNEPAFQRHCGRLTRIATALDARLIPMRTNVRQTRWRECHWEKLGFGSALAATALTLEKLFSRAFLPGSVDFGNLFPWGSHPLSDPLFSTSKTRIVHDGSAYTRSDKIEVLSQNALAMRNLHVCFRGQDGLGQDDTNCCRCEKCFRTMTVLEILGKLDRAELFDARKFDVRKISRVFAETKAEIGFYREIRNLALRHDRTDIVREIDLCFSRSRRLSRLLSVSRSLARLPVLWRLGAAVERRALSGSLR